MTSQMLARKSTKLIVFKSIRNIVTILLVTFLLKQTVLLTHLLDLMMDNYKSILAAKRLSLMLQERKSGSFSRLHSFSIGMQS